MAFRCGSSRATTRITTVGLSGASTPSRSSSNHSTLPRLRPIYVVNSLKREQLIALNSTLLHELYFASLAFGDGKPTDELAGALTRDFGSVDRWRSEFVAMRADWPAAQVGSCSSTCRATAGSSIRLPGIMARP